MGFLGGIIARTLECVPMDDDWDFVFNLSVFKCFALHYLLRTSSQYMVVVIIFLRSNTL